MANDLFGRKIIRPKSQIQLNVERLDEQSRPDRVRRWKWINEVFPKDYGLLITIEAHHTFDEAKTTYVNGEFVATILLANAFLEHWLGSFLARRGYHSESRGGLKSIIDCMRTNNLLHEHLIAQIDRLRETRNPFVHAKSMEHEHRLTQRMIRERRDHLDILEADAKIAVSLMYEIVVSPLSL